MHMTPWLLSWKTGQEGVTQNNLDPPSTLTPFCHHYTAEVWGAGVSGLLGRPVPNKARGSGFACFPQGLEVVRLWGVGDCRRRMRCHCRSRGLGRAGTTNRGPSELGGNPKGTVGSWAMDRTECFKCLSPAVGGGEGGGRDDTPATCDPCFVWEGSRDDNFPVNSGSLRRPDSLATRRLVG